MQGELIAGLPPVRTPKRRPGPVQLLSTTATKATESGVGALNLPRPSWAAEGRPLEATQPKKREKGQPPTALDRVRGKRVQLLRSRIVANALLRLPDPLVDRGKYEKTLSCGRTVTRARFDGTHKGATVDFGACCRYRWCEFCSAARLGEWRKRSGPELATWKELHHLVVSIPTVRQRKTGAGERLNRLTAVELRCAVKEMLKATREIANSVRRTDRLPWKAIRHVEVTYTYERDGKILDWYHPHIHFVVENEAAARSFLQRWLKRFPDAHAKGQFCERVTLDKAMREVFKYVLKPVKSEREEMRDSEGRAVVDAKTGKRVYSVKYVGMRADALDVIFTALRGIRLHQAMGFKLPMPDDLEVGNIGVEEDGTLPAALPDFECDSSSWKWSDGALDWLSDDMAGLNRETGVLEGASFPLCGDPLPMRYLKMLAAYEAQIFAGVAVAGGVRTNGLVARCYQMRRADREAARGVLSGLTSSGGV